MRELASTELTELIKEQKERQHKNEYQANMKEEEAAKIKALEKGFPKSIKDTVKPDYNN